MRQDKSSFSTYQIKRQNLLSALSGMNGNSFGKKKLYAYMLIHERQAVVLFYWAFGHSGKFNTISRIHSYEDTFLFSNHRSF